MLGREALALAMTLRAEDATSEPAIAAAMLRECPDCGLFQHLPALAAGDVAVCRRCDAHLRKAHRNSLNRALWCYLGALVLLLLAMQLPFLSLRSVGRLYTASIFTGPARLGDHGMWEISLVVLTTLVGVPVLQLGLILTVLLGVRLPRPPRVLPRLWSWVEALRPWSMVEVFLLGAFVAYTRLQAIATVDVGPALYALAGVMLCMVAADVELDHEDVWEAFEARGLSADVPPQPQYGLIGCDCCGLVVQARPRSRCPRCRSRLRLRKPYSLNRCWALAGAAVCLYVPANIYPILTLIRLGRGQPSTIIGGVIELAQAQMWPLALLVLLASIVVPLFKLVALFSMLVMTADGSAARLRGRTRLYRFVDSIGRWSMIDVFMLTILVALVRLGFVATVLPGIGAVAFAAVVVLTMFAAASFDPRLMWDAAAAAGHDVEAEDGRIERTGTALA